MVLVYAKRPFWEAADGCRGLVQQSKGEKEREETSYNYIKAKTFHLLLTVQRDLTRVALVTSNHNKNHFS